MDLNLDRNMEFGRIKNFINGEWEESKSRETVIEIASNMGIEVRQIP